MLNLLSISPNMDGEEPTLDSLEELVAARSNNYGWPALHYALRYKTAGLASLVLKLLPEEAALSTAPIPRVKLLYDDGIPYKVVTKYLPGYTSFYLAARSNNTSVAIALIHLGCLSNQLEAEPEGTLIEETVYDGSSKPFDSQKIPFLPKVHVCGILKDPYDWKEMESPSSRKVALDQSNYTPLYWAIHHENQEMIQAIFDSQDSATVQQFIHKVASYDYIVKPSIHHRPEPSISYNAFALSSNKPAIFNLLLFYWINSKGHLYITSPDQLHPDLISAFQNYCLSGTEYEWLIHAQKANDATALMLLVAAGVADQAKLYAAKTLQNAPNWLK